MANSAVVGLLRVLLTANTAEYEAAMKKAADTATKFSRDFRTIGQQATQVGSTLTAALTVPLVGLAAASTKAAVQFESSFAGVRKTVDATDAEFDQMAESFRRLAKEIPVNVNELNRLGEAAGALGIPKAEIVDFAKVMAQLGVTTNLTSDQAAESIAKIQTVFQAAGKETSNFASALVHLGNNGASTEQEILALAQRIASAGNAVGMSQGQVLGFAAAVANVGIEAEAGGSAISKVFGDISIAVSNGTEAVQDFAAVAGMTSEAFSALFKSDAASAVQAFIEGLGLMAAAGGDLNVILKNLEFTELRQARALRDLALSGDNLSRSLQTANVGWRENSALTEEARKRFETTEAQLTLLWNRVKDVGITIGNALLPALQSAVKFADVLLPIVEMLARAFAELPGPIQVGVLAIGAMAAAAGPLLIVFGKIAESSAALIGMFGKKGIATRLLAGELITLTGASTALSASLVALGKAAGVAAAAFVGWQIGRLIADLTGLDEQINRTINRLGALEQMRKLTAQGRDGDVQVTARLAQMETELAAAIRNGEKAKAASLQKDIEAIKHDQTRLAMLDTINKAIQQGADKQITYAEAIKFNEQKLKEWQAAQKGTTEEVKKAAPAVDTFSRALEKNVAHSKKATVGLEEFKDSTERTADAVQLAVKAMMADAGREAARLVGLMEQSGTEAGKRFVEGLKRQNEQFLSTVTDLQRRWILLEEDSVEKRHRLIRLEFDRKRAELDRFGTFYEDHLQLLNAEEAQALREAEADYEASLDRRKEATISFREEMGHILASIPGRLVDAIQSGDFGRALQDIAGDVGSLIGGQIGQMFGPAGRLIGAELGRLAGTGFGKLWDSLFGSRGRDLVVQFAQSMGGFDALRQRLNALGAEGERLWRNLTQGVGRNNPEQAQAAINAVTTALDKLQQREQAFNQGLTSSLNQIVALGGRLSDLPSDLQGLLSSLQQAGQLTQENIDLLGILGQSGGPTWQQMQEAAQRYGIEVDSLGERFQQQRIHEAWQQIIDDIDLLQRGGADVNAMLNGMSDEISELVQDSLQFGTAIPENMRPWIEKLIEAGQLVDENGDKIEDINRLTFGDTLQTSLQKLIDSINVLIRTLGGVPPAIAAIPSEVNVDVNYRPGPFPKPGDGGGWQPGDPYPGEPDYGPNLAMSRGGIVPQYAAMGKIITGAFQPRGTDTVGAMLTPGELVLNEGQQGNIADSLQAAMRFVENVRSDMSDFAARQMGTSQMGPIQSVTIMEVDKRELGRAVADVLPGELRRLGVRVRAS